MGFLRTAYHVVQNATTTLPRDIVAHESSPLHILPRPVLYLIAFACLLMAACVAGLTLGLMTLDTVGLEILMQSSNEREAAAARAIMPVRKDAHLLLVTLLLSNTIATELLPLVLEVLWPGGVYALLTSVFSIMLFGEIIPQAICSRHALEIGSRMIGFVKVIRVLLYPIAAPIAFMLDWLLGHELGTIYSREELKGLVDMHGRSKYGTLTRDETMIIQGTLDFSQRSVIDVLTKAENVFSLNVDAILDEHTLKVILEKGHSRVPLYDGSPDNIICILLVKQLLLVDPAEKLPIRALIASKCRRSVVPVIECSNTTLISDMLNEFQEGQSHLGIVYDEITKPNRKFLGILTIEDIIEEILQEEIVDETDVYVDNTNFLSAKRQRDLALIKRNSTVVTHSRLPGTCAILLRQIPALSSLKKNLASTTSNAIRRTPSYNRRARSDGFTLQRAGPAESAPLLGISGPTPVPVPDSSTTVFPSREGNNSWRQSPARLPGGSDTDLSASSSSALLSPLRRIERSPKVGAQSSPTSSVQLRPLPTYVPREGQEKVSRLRSKSRPGLSSPVRGNNNVLDLGDRDDLFNDEIERKDVP